MLYFKDASYFRRYYKEIEARNDDKSIDVNFINTFHPDPQRREKGFSNLVYGSRKNIGGFLRASSLNVAADQQAIYELIQNADDCNSTFFSVNYNEKYLLCINNGDYFTNSNMSAIINVGDSDKHGEDIGTFGIGFKILHRLLGEDDGLNAIINDYAGPIIFSWNKFFQFDNFIKGEPMKIGGYDKEIKRYNPDLDNENPWLVKIAYTCFPTYLNESIRLADYETKKVIFSQEELTEMREFLQESLKSVNLNDDNYLRTGSIFFIKLGEGKFKFIDENIENLISGISYSFNFLNSLKKIYINGQEIKKQEVEIFKHQYDRDSDNFLEISPRNNERDIKFKFAYYSDYKQSERIIGSPNIYNFFSMDEEKNNFRFLLHCNAFDMNNDRRKLQPDSQINERLFPVIANELIGFIDNKKTTNIKQFRNLFATLLLSQEPINKPNINNHFFYILKNYYQSNIPTDSGFSNDLTKIKIKGTLLKIQPSDLGCEDIEWFYFHDSIDDFLIEEAKSTNKLGLKKWDIVDLITYSIDKGKIDVINAWIQKSDEAHYINPDKKDWTYKNFLGEIDRNITDANMKKVALIKLFKFSDGLYHSLNEVFENPELILISEKTSGIKYELRNIGLTISSLDVSKSSNLNRIISSKISEQKLFQIIAEKVKTNTLKPDQKKNLFLALTQFESAEKLIGDIELFLDRQKRIRPLNKLIRADPGIPIWLFPFKMVVSEYFPELDKYLISSNKIYSKLVYEEWDEIIKNASFTKLTIKQFYATAINYYKEEESSLLLSEKQCIFTDDGFLSINEIFYHRCLSEVSRYEILRNCMKKLTDYETPCKEILEFLQQKPFSIKEDILKDHIKAADLTHNETLAIFEYAEKAEIDLFTYGYFSEAENGEVSFSVDKSVVQYYASSQDINDFIEENLSTKFQLLPKLLSKYITKVLRNTDLQETILDELKGKVQDHVESLLDILTGVSLIRFYKSVSEFKITVKEKYLKSDFEYKLFSNLPEDQIEGFNTKLIISHEDNEFSATEIANTDTFKIEDIKLTLSKILTENQLSDNAKVVSGLIHLLNNTGIPKSKLDKIFGIEKDIDNEWRKDKLTTLLAVESNILENSEQLAFVLLYHKYIENIDLSTIKIHRADGKDDSLNDTWYSQNVSFIEKFGILEEQYFDINNLFGLNTRNHFFTIDNKTRILYQPYFDNEKSKFDCDYLKTNLTNEEKIELLDFIFAFWSESQANKRLIKSIDWSEISGNKIEAVLGFTPTESIWDENIALDDELFPDWIKVWGESTEKQTFLMDIGANMNISPISLLRKSFITSNLFPQKDISNNELLSQTLLNNTLTWISENEINIDSEVRYQLLLAIAEEIDVEFDEVYDFDALASSLEWNIDYYRNWKEETDCEIGVFMHDGQMPVLISYNDYVVRNETRDDYAFDKVNNFLFINSQIQKIENILSEVADDKNIPFDQDHLNKLLFAKNNSNSLISSDEYERLRLENEKLKELVQSYTANQEGHRKKGGLSLTEQKAINLESRRMVKQSLLQHNEFDCTDWNVEDDFSIIQRKIRKNDDLIDIVVVSAQSKQIHLSPFAFNILASNPNNQLFVRDSHGIHNVLFNDIFSDNQQVNMIFDTNYVPNDVLAQLAQVFNYVTNTRFVIENPHFSANSMILGFGLDNKNSGKVAISSDDQDF